MALSAVRVAEVVDPPCSSGLPEAQAGQGIIVEDTAPLPPAPAPVMPRPFVPSATQLAEARAEALAEGRAMGLAEAEAALSAQRAELTLQAQTLAAALARLAEPPMAEVDALTRSVSEAVARLASERAGLAIDAHPAAFAERIARLGERVAQGMRDVKIYLHPDDIAALLPVLVEGCPAELAALAAARLVPNATLRRGDADLRAPGLHLADLIENPASTPHRI
ncbi:flagellar assembly protein FliH [Pseudotabrizicola algicola]|nr:flagellar assembly protein FliH [Pseudotabrizicola algicola]